jgi:hypothetical protein
MNEYRLQQLKEQRKEIHELLALFERAAFRPLEKNNGGDPTAALNGIYETRIALQKRGAAFISDENAAMFFHQLQKQLLDLENEVREKYPQVMDLAIQWRGKPINTQDRIDSISQALGEIYQQAAMFIRNKASKVCDSPKKAHSILSELDKKINQLIDSEDRFPPLINEMRVSYPPHLKDVYELLITYFNEEELKTLCFYLPVDYESLKGEGKANKARELVLYSYRQNLLSRLRDEVTNQRPSIPWPDISQNS